MVDHANRPWWPKTRHDVPRTIQRLKTAGGDELFAFLVIAAAGGEWKIFTKALEDICYLRSETVQKLLTNVGANSAWSNAYSTMGLPTKLFALFIKVVEMGQAITREAPQVKSSSQLRRLVLEKALLASHAQSPDVSDTLKAELMR